jgi:hypothetical protein
MDAIRSCGVNLEFNKIKEIDQLGVKYIKVEI